MSEDLALRQLQALTARIESIRAYQGTEVFNHFAQLFEQIKQLYMADLIDVKKEELETKQGAIRQVMLLQACMTGPAGIVPKV
jgi:hypothetical protein